MDSADAGRDYQVGSGSSWHGRGLDHSWIDSVFVLVPDQKVTSDHRLISSICL